MTNRLRFLWILTILAVGSSVTPAAPAGTNQPAGLRLTVELLDGSKIIGKNGDDNFQFRSDVLGEMKLSLERIRSIECQPKTNSVQLITANGDTLMAQFVTKVVRMETVFGGVKLPANSIRRLTISTVGKPGQRREGLVALWSGEENGNDLVGTNQGTLQGGVSFAPGKTGQAFVFNGSSTSVLVPASTSLNLGLGDGFTLKTWIKPEDIYSHIVENLFEWNSGFGGIGVHFEVSVNTYGDMYANIKDTTGRDHAIESAGGILVTNILQQLALTYDKASGVAVLYLNGTAVANQNLGSFTPQTSYDLYFGKRPSGPFAGSYFNGLMDEISIYNRALSASEIQTDYEAGQNGN